MDDNSAHIMTKDATANKNAKVNTQLCLFNVVDDVDHGMVGVSASQGREHARVRKRSITRGARGRTTTHTTAHDTVKRAREREASFDQIRSDRSIASNREPHHAGPLSWMYTYIILVTFSIVLVVVDVVDVVLFCCSLFLLYK
jgi:hypothetical protein